MTITFDDVVEFLETAHLTDNQYETLKNLPNITAIYTIRIETEKVIDIMYFSNGELVKTTWHKYKAYAQQRR